MGIYIDEFYHIISYYISLIQKGKFNIIESLNKKYNITSIELEKMLKLYYSDSNLSKEMKDGLKMIQ